MATKTARRTTTVNNSDMSRPQSPTRFSRLQEKVELQNLNDRLATYIERVRTLESENNRLYLQVQTSQESVEREVSSVKSMYESELNDARKLLDDVSKEKAKLQLENTKWKNELSELQARLVKKEKECAATERQLQLLEPRLQDMQSRMSQALSERKKVEDENKELKAENERLNRALNQIRTELDEETLRRIDLENRIQSLKEELEFKGQLHEKEMTETRTRKQVEITEIDGRLQEEYEQKLAESLRDLRDQYEETMRRNREEIEQMYESKLGDMTRLNDSYSNSANQTQEELRETRTRMDTYSSKINELEALNGALTNRIKDLERRLQDERDAQMALLAAKDQELRSLQDLMTRQLKEYQDLMDIKVALDLELAAYNKLLEGEESRLNIVPGRRSATPSVSSQRSTPVPPPASASNDRTPSRGAKRKRTLVSEDEQSSTSSLASTSSATGGVEIVEQDVDGKFVKLGNKGRKDISIGGWQLIRTSGDQHVTYKFHRSTVIKSGAFTIVWSSDAGVTHSPPTDLVMRGQQWITGKEVTTVLMNHNKEEVAQRQSSAQQLSSSAYFSSGDMGGSQLEQIISQQRLSRRGVPTPWTNALQVQADGLQDQQERCNIM